MPARVPPISAGELDQLVTIQQRSTTKDAVGQQVETWSTFLANVWAAARPLRGAEFFAAGQTQAQETILFRIRYRDGVTSGMRVVWRGQPYALTAPPVDVEGAKHTLELYCTGGRP
jgi:SPP1 family predicted phage head-tail adaptor